MLLVRSIVVPAFVILATVSFGAGCSAEPPTEDSTGSDGDGPEIGQVKEELRITLGANGDSCTVRTNPDGTTVPGTEKDGECCATADTKDCVIILKPFPKLYFRW